MALIIVIQTGDFQIRWNVLSLSFSEREIRALGLSGFYHHYLISNDCIQHSGKIPIRAVGTAAAMAAALFGLSVFLFTENPLKCFIL